jgi:hypothetical protein
LFITAGKSFVYKRKSVGPNRESCGTACLILAQFETVVLWFVLLSILTLWYLALMYDWKSSLSVPIIPHFSIFYIKISWFTQSNAFVRSQKYLPIFFYCVRHLILYLLVYKQQLLVYKLCNIYKNTKLKLLKVNAENMVQQNV